MPLLDTYQPGNFFDEMFVGPGEVRPHYSALFDHHLGLAATVYA